MLNKFKKIFGESINPVLLILAVLASVLVLGIFLRLMERPVKAVCNYILQEDDNAGMREEKIVPVEASVVKKGQMNKRITSVGKLRANAAITIKSDISARIKRLAFEQGARVKKDDVLIEFEDADIKARLSQAQAELKVRELDFDRIKKLFEQKVESQKKFDEATGQLAMAKAKVEEATASLEKTVIKASFDGTVGITEFSEGAYVQASQELVTLVDETPIKVDFKVPERFVNDVGVGQTIEVKVDAFSKRTFTGTLEAVDSKIDPESHSLLIRGSIPNDDGQLKPGLFANVNLVIGEQGDVIMVEESAVERQGDKEFVYAVEKGRARQSVVITGHHEGGKVEIKAGLTPGQIVVVSGQQKLGHGLRVRVTNLGDASKVGKADSISLDGTKAEEKTDSSMDKKQDDKEQQPPVVEEKKG